MWCNKIAFFFQAFSGNVSARKERAIILNGVHFFNDTHIFTTFLKFLKIVLSKESLGFQWFLLLFIISVCLRAIQYRFNPSLSFCHAFCPASSVHFTSKVSHFPSKCLHSLHLAVTLTNRQTNTPGFRVFISSFWYIPKTNTFSCICQHFFPPFFFFWMLVLFVCLSVFSVWKPRL